MAESPSWMFGGIHTIGEMGLNKVGEQRKAGAQAEPKGEQRERAETGNKNNRRYRRKLIQRGGGDRSEDRGRREAW